MMCAHFTAELQMSNSTVLEFGHRTKYSAQIGHPPWRIGPTMRMYIVFLGHM